MNDASSLHIVQIGVGWAMVGARVGDEGCWWCGCGSGKEREWKLDDGE